MKTTKLSRKHLPAGLASLSTKKTFGLNVVTSAADVVFVCDTQWGGGTRYVYQLLRIGDGTLWNASVKDGDRVLPQPGLAIVVTGRWCGQDVGVCVYVWDTDVAKFFGAEHLVEVPPGMPGAVAADWLTEQADESKGPTAKRLRTAAELCRMACR